MQAAELQKEARYVTASEGPSEGGGEQAPPSSTSGRAGWARREALAQSKAIVALWDATPPSEDEEVERYSRWNRWWDRSPHEETAPAANEGRFN